MSSKGIGPLERRAEFVALATALVSASSILVFEIVTSNGAEIDAMWVRPSTVDRTLKEHAEPIDRNLGPHAPSQIVVPEPSSIAPRFQAALDAGVGEPTVASLHYPVRVASGALVIDAVRYVEPVVPAPRDLLVAQYIDTIVPEEVERHEQLAARFDDAPFDIGWVTASARFDLAVARAAFGEGDADREPIPLAWWHENIQFLDVVVEREALVAGTWSDRRTLEPLPGRFSLRLRLGGAIDRRAGDEILDLAGAPEVTDEILRPTFYRTVGETWAAPLEPPPVAEEDPKQRRLRDRADTLERRLARLRDHLASLGPPPAAPAGAGGGDGGRNVPGGGIGPGGQAGRRNTGATDRAGAGERNRLEKLIERAEKELESVLAELDELRPPPPVIDPNIVEMWAHDLDVEPGATYRYRFSVRVHNPFFGRTISLVDEQQHLAEPFAIDSLSSEWSSGVLVDPPLRLFVTGATPGGVGHLNMGRVTAEVFRFQDGTWWRRRFSAQPGDRIGALVDATDERAAVDCTTEWFVLDISVDLDGRGDGLVLLQNIETGEIAPVRIPSQEREDPAFHTLIADATKL